MSAVRRLWTQLRNFATGRNGEGRLREEMEEHLAQQTEENMRAGMSPQEARRRAVLKFGSAEAVRESYHAEESLPLFDSLLRDGRYAFRILRKSPVFSVVIVLTLALGIGANTAVFSVMNAVLLRSLPVSDPSRVVYLRPSGSPSNTGTINSIETVSFQVYDALRKQTHAVDPVIAYVPLSSGKVAVRIGAQPEEAEGEMVSGAIFSGLGVPLIHGRGFTAQDETTHAPVAVISYRYWTRRFARNPGVIGQTLFVNSVPMTIVGVTANGFEGVETGESTDFWIPLQNRPELNAYGNPPEDGKLYLNDPKWWCLRLVGRLAPGVTRAQALAQLQPVFQAAAYEGLPGVQPGERKPTLHLLDAKSFPGYEDTYGKPLRLLMMMVGLVLLIALSNVAMLLLARNANRLREFSLRLALGATRKALFRQLLLESMLLVSAGGLLAWLFAASTTSALGAWARIESSLAPDHTVLLFAFGVLLLTAILFGVAPLRLALSPGPALALKSDKATSYSSTGKSRTNRVIVVLQMTFCMVLLVGGGLLIRTLRNLENTPLGMDVNRLVVFGIKPNTRSLADTNAFYRELISRLRALPGVEEVTIMEERLGSGWSDNSRMKVDGRLTGEADGSSGTVRQNVAGPDFFRTLGVPVLQGRDFSDSDTSASPHVGIINEQFARRFLSGQNPLGHMIGTEDGDFSMTIVGVVKDHKYRSIAEDPIPMAWYMYAQIPVLGEMHVELRVQGNPLAILPAAGKVVRRIDPNLPLIEPMTQREQFDTTIAQQLLFARLAGFFGLLAVILVATGLYGTLAYRVSKRTVEIGVRMAVGARRAQLVWMVLRDSLVLTSAGIVIGLPLAILVARALSSVLYAVTPLDIVSYLFAAVTVAIVAVAASAVPAQRAAQVDPVVALRAE
ncbi:MAG TPA: ABC transporter permease [Acidobacteriaceae bacterium]|nr:ABC transporter permease [Acidobacteriaceae bacterium]